MAATTSRSKEIIHCDPDKCNGCEVCEYVCSWYHGGEINWKRSRIRAVKIEPIYSIAITCRKCDEPACKSACPRDAISQNAAGVIHIDKDKCNGCGWCVEACEFGVMKLQQDTRLAFCCDYCEDLDGLKCVELCPKEALSYASLDSVGFSSAVEAAASLIADSKVSAGGK